MPSLTEQVQTNIRAITGTSGMYWEDWHALCDQAGIAKGQINERILAYYISLGNASVPFSAAYNYFLLNPSNIANQSTLWANAVTANGGTFTAGQKTALQAFIDGCVADGNWAKIACFGPQIGQDLAACKVQYRNGAWEAATYTNFVGGDFAPTTGLNPGAGNTTKYLDTGVSILSLTKANFGMGAMVLAASANATGTLLGATYPPTGDTDRFYLFQSTGSSQAAIGGGILTGIWNGPATVGLCAVETTGLSTITPYVQGVNPGGSLVSPYNNDGFQSGTIQAFRTAGGFYGDQVMGGYYVGNNLNQAALSARWATFKTAVGR